MNNQILFIGMILIYCLPKLSICQEREMLKGMWNGKLNDSLDVYTYILNIDEIKDNKFTGTTYANGENFYSETSIKGVIKNNKMNITEEKVITSNYPDKSALCLLSFFLTIDKRQLSGYFIPRNHFSKCRNGTVIFQKMEKKEPVRT